jgi:hypothetical protein
LPKNISRGKRRWNQEQEKVFHEYAGGPFRVNEGGQTGGRGKEKLSQGMERNSTLVTGSRTVSATGTITKKTVTEEVDEEDDEVMFEMEKGPRMRLPSQTPATKPKYCSRWMRRQQTTTMATQTTTTDPEKLAIKMESLNLKAIAKKQEKDLQAEILSGSLRQERLKKQLQECSRNRRQASATATNVECGTSCRGATASRRLAGADDDNTDDRRSCSMT